MTTRREKVLLELEDHFSSQMVKPIAATKALDAALDSLSGSAVRTARDEDAATKSTKALGNEIEKTSVKTRTGARDIDRYSGRLRLLTEAAVTLGPALVPIGAVAVPAVVALAAGLGAAAGAAGVAVLAFHGVGDALKALDAYQLDPSAAHLKKMREEFEKIGPTGVEFVKFLDDLEPQLKSLQEVARVGLFPDVEAGISSFLTMLPQVRVLLFNLSTELGHLTAEAGAAMSGDGARAFFDYLEKDAAPTLAAFAHTLGNLAQGFGSLMMAFSPLSRDFASGMESMSASFAKWAAELSKTEGFRNFVAYVRESGPQVLALLGSLATAFIAIARASAPVGAAVLPALTALARVLALIADSPIGPPLFTASVAMLALARATTIANAAMLKFSGTSAAATKNLAMVGAGLNFAAILGGIYAVDKAMDKVFGDHSVDGSNLIKNLTDLGSSDAAAELDKIGVSIKNINSSAEQASDKVFGFLPGDTTWGEARDNVVEVDQALAQLVNSGNADQAAAAMDRIVASAKEQGVSTADATKWFKEYTAALNDSATAEEALKAKESADAARKLAKAHNQQAASADKAANSTKGLVGTMQDEAAAALGAFDAETQYREALKAAEAQAKKNEAGIRDNSKAALANRGALSQLAGAWNNQSDAVKNNVNRWHEAKGAFIDTAVAMNVPIAKAKALADRLMEIPKSVVIKTEAKTLTAAEALQRLKKQAEDVDGAYRLNFIVTQSGAIPRRDAFDVATNRASGGPIYGAGTKTSDDVPVMASNGEFMMSAAAVDHYGLGTMFAMNARHLAGGGSVDGHRSHDGTVTHQFGPDTLWGLSHEADAAAHSLAGLGQMGKREVEQRGKFLDHEAKLAQKALDTAKARLDEERGALADLKAARDDFARSVSANFRSDLFGGDLATQAANGALGSGFGNSVYAFAQANGLNGAYNMGDWVQQYLDTLSASQLATLQAHAAVGTAHQDAASADTFSSLLAQLRSMGLTGGAYRELAASGDVNQAQAYASMSPGAIAALVRSYQERERALHRLEGRVGDAAFGRQIEKQTKVVQRTADLTAEIRDQSRELNRLSRSIDHRLQQIEHHQSRQAKDTGAAVGAAINNASAAATRRGGKP